MVVELKSVEPLADVHHKQTLTHRRIAGVRVGLLVNFNEPIVPEGLSRKVL